LFYSYADRPYAECCYADLPNAECRYAECRYAECRYAECHYAECHYAECRYTEYHGAWLMPNFANIISARAKVTKQSSLNQSVGNDNKTL
jgi:hypothetical protein